ncbi:MAG: DMT family transporter [Solirubrobacterales bacterium]|nr:DMT family transporter [Solirubrobacterales bacterium]
MTPRAWSAFAAASLLWGIPYLFIKIAVDDGVPPVFLSWARVALGGAVLLAVSWRAGLLPTLRGHGRWIASFAVLELAIPFPLIAASEQHISSSLAAILIAGVPLIVALLALRFDHSERVTGSRLAGVLVGLAGVVVLMGIDVAGEPDELLGAGMVLLSAVGYAAGPMLLKRKLSHLDSRAVMGAALLVTTLLLTPAALLWPPETTPPAEAWAAIAVLGLLCTAAALAVFGVLVAEAGPGRALIITYVNPVVAVALGVVVLGERPGPGAVAGLLLIVAGSYLATGGRVPARRAAAQR